MTNKKKTVKGKGDSGVVSPTVQWRDYESGDIVTDFDDKHISFVYLIKCNNKHYIGKRRISRGWQKYTGSCVSLNDDIADGMQYKKFILYRVNSKSAANFCEAMIQFYLDVLHDSRFYNRGIMCKVNSGQLGALDASHLIYIKKIVKKIKKDINNESPKNTQSNNS